MEADAGAGVGAETIFAPSASEVSLHELVVECEGEPLGLKFRCLPPDAVIIEDVQPGTYAARENLRPGDEIQAINGMHPAKLRADEFMAATTERPLSLGIVRRCSFDLKEELPSPASSNSDNYPANVSTDNTTDGLDFEPPLQVHWRTLTTQLDNLCSGLDMMKDRLDMKECADDEAAFGDFQSVQPPEDFADFAKLNAPPHWAGPLPPRPSSHARTHASSSTLPATPNTTTKDSGLMVQIHPDGDEDARSDVCDVGGGRGDVADNNQCDVWRDELRELERYHDSLIEKWIVESAAIIRCIGVKPVKVAQPYFDCLAKRRKAQIALDAAASRLSEESIRHQQLVETLKRSSCAIEASESWEDLDAITGLESSLEEHTDLCTSISSLESRLDASATQYSQALASLHKASARAARLERRYKPQDTNSSVYIARRFFQKQWKYEQRIARTKCRMSEILENLRHADEL